MNKNKVYPDESPTTYKGLINESYQKQTRRRQLIIIFIMGALATLALLVLFISTSFVTLDFFLARQKGQHWEVKAAEDDESQEKLGTRLPVDSSERYIERPPRWQNKLLQEQNQQDDQSAMYSIFDRLLQTWSSYWNEKTNRLEYNFENATCSTEPSLRKDCFPEGGCSEAACKNRGCCWKPVADENACSPAWCFYPSQPPPFCSTPDVVRMDCHPEPGASPEVCHSRGCCWWPSQDGSNNVPYCFYPQDNGTYSLSNRKDTATGFSAKLIRPRPSRWPRDIQTLQLDVMYETDTRVHFKIYDPNVRRYEVPIPTPKVSQKASKPTYTVTYQEEPFGIVVSRKDGTVLFDTRHFPLTFSDQLIDITTKLPSNNIYGLGEHQYSFLLNASNPVRFAYWARDQPLGDVNNLYGVHPFFLGLEDNGKAYGVFLLNSNAMETSFLTRNGFASLTYHTIGGILDFYVVMGPTPDDVISQYSDIVGRPVIPPYWSLGFHLCRWGYQTIEHTKAVVKRMRDGEFPYDVQWNDIDYMQSWLDFTYDKKNFKGLPDLLQDLHNHGQHYIIMIDAAIHNQTGYEAYDKGIEMDVFVRNTDNTGPLIGKVWPGTTVYPDFTNPQSVPYWRELLAELRRTLPYDGIWLDMNEPSSFVDGSLKGCPADNRYDYPPYVPSIIDGKLMTKTICPSARQHLSLHYDLHSLYGYSEINATVEALKTIFDKRYLLISRSTFAGQGRLGSHWTGDNSATWHDLCMSIPALLNNNMYGQSMVGSDICGFLGETYEELCVRWTQLGAFYTFMRNHNTIGARDQDPASPIFTAEGQGYMRDAMRLRYRLLPYLYTLFYFNHRTGRAVVRPMIFQYPTDRNTVGIDKQFLWGDALMISPVLDQGHTSVDIYVPIDTYYDFYNGTVLSGKGSYTTLDAPLSKINLHIRAGTIIPLQDSAVTTTLSRKTPFTLLVALQQDGRPSSGFLYWDDGESFLQDKAEIGNLISFSASQSSSATSGELKSTLIHQQYNTTMTLGSVVFYGVQNKPNQVMVNQHVERFTWSQGVLSLKMLNTSLMSAINITWS